MRDRREREEQAEKPLEGPLLGLGNLSGSYTLNKNLKPGSNLSRMI